MIKWKKDISTQVLYKNSIELIYLIRINNMKPQGNQQEEQREREQINEQGGGHRTPDPGPQKQR